MIPRGVKPVQSAPVRSNPEHARTVLAERPDAGGTQTSGDFLIRLVDPERARRAVEPVESGAVRPDPDGSPGVLEKRIDAVVAERSGFRGIVPVVREASGARVEHIDAAGECADPDRSVAVFEQGGDCVFGDGAGRPRRAGQMGEGFEPGVQARQPAACTHPGRPVAGHHQGDHTVIDQAGRVGRVTGVGAEGIHLRMEEADARIPRPHPEHSRAVLEEGEHLIVGKTRRVGLAVPVARECPGRTVESVEPAGE